MQFDELLAAAEVLAEDLREGEEEVLSNASLRALFGIGRVTSGLRAKIVQAVQAVGLEVVSDTGTEPLIVRKPPARVAAPLPPVQPDGGDDSLAIRKRQVRVVGSPPPVRFDPAEWSAGTHDPESGRRPAAVPVPAGPAPRKRAGVAAVSAAVTPSDRKRSWHRRKRVWALVTVLLLMLVGGLNFSEQQPAAEAAAERLQPPPASTPTTPAPTTTATTPEEPVTLAQAQDMVDDDLYAEALAAAALLGEDDESYISRRIANRLARRTISWVRKDRLLRARPLVVELRNYPTTARSRSARRAYFAATERQRQRAARIAAAERRAARARARARAARFCSKTEKRSYRNTGVVKPGCASYAAARQAAKIRREAERQRRAAAAAAAAAPSYDAPSVDMSGPSTTNWCGKRDGDGDGIYCE